MILNKLFSDTGLLPELIFKRGLNIILGKYSVIGKDINGIGKTTIVDLVDFCLLADGPKHNYRLEKYAFLKIHTISLSITLKDRIIILTRRFSDLNKIYVKEEGSQQIEYSDTEYRFILGKQIIDDTHYSGVVEPSWYRTLMNFFIQNDHSFFQRDSHNVINFINIGLRKPELISFLYYLIGYDNTYIYEYDILQVKQKLMQSEHNRIVKNIESTTGKELSSFKAENDTLEAKIIKYEEQAERLNFIDINIDIFEKSESIQKRISELQGRYFELEHKLAEIRKSVSFGVDINIKRVQELYSELNKEFSQFLVRSLEEVQKFRTTIIQNRKRFLVERELVYSSEIENIKQEILNLEDKKKLLYSKLDQPKVLDDIKTAYSFLGDIKTKREQNRVLSDELDRIERELSTNKKQISDAVNEMVLNKPSLDEALKTIKSTFYNIVINSVEISDNDLPTHLLIEPRSNMKSPVNIDIQVPRSGSLGKDRFKILAFDLTVFLTSVIEDRSLPRFLIHDGVFHGIAHKTRIKFLNYVNSVFSKLKNAQYIVTLNEDEISLPEDYDGELSHLDFNLDSCVIKVVEDNPASMLFGKEF